MKYEFMLNMNLILIPALRWILTWWKYIHVYAYNKQAVRKLRHGHQEFTLYHTVKHKNWKAKYIYIETSFKLAKVNLN